MPNSNGAVDLNSLSPEEQEKISRLAEENAPDETPEESDKQQVLTAFLVIVGFDGNPQVMRLNDPSLQLRSEPTPDLVYGAAATILKDLEATETAQATAAMTVQALQQQAQAAMQQQQAAQVASRLDPSRLRG